MLWQIFKFVTNLNKAKIGYIISLIILDVKINLQNYNNQYSYWYMTANSYSYNLSKQSSSIIKPLR